MSKHFIPVATGRKLNVNKTFRRRPARLLNILSTFNLCHVSTGMAFTKHIIANHYFQGSSWFLCKRQVSKSELKLLHDGIVHLTWLLALNALDASP